MELTKSEFLELLKGIVRSDAAFCREVITTCLTSLRDDDSQRIVEDLYFDTYCKEKVYTVRSISNSSVCRRFFDIRLLCDFLTKESLVQRKCGITKAHVNQAIAEHKPLCGYYITLSSGLAQKC